MNRIVVFGKPASGKSTLSRQMSAVTNIKLIPLDLIEYEKSGERISAEIYAAKHAELIAEEKWIIEGLGTIPSFWERIDAADTLIFVDLPYWVSYWWVIKRFLKSPLVKPLGWPDGSSVLKGTKAGFKYLKLSPKFWTPQLLEKIQQRAHGKRIYRITTVRELNQFPGKF